MANITSNEVANSERYERTEPKFLGNLHERMKYVMAAMQKHYQVVPSELWQAVHDLQTEVRYYEPVNPPFGKRPARGSA